MVPLVQLFYFKKLRFYVSYLYICTPKHGGVAQLVRAQDS